MGAIYIPDDWEKVGELHAQYSFLLGHDSFTDVKQEQLQFSSIQINDGAIDNSDPAHDNFAVSNTFANPISHSVDVSEQAKKLPAILQMLVSDCSVVEKNIALNAASLLLETVGNIGYCKQIGILPIVVDLIVFCLRQIYVGKSEARQENLNLIASGLVVLNQLMSINGFQQEYTREELSQLNFVLCNEVLDLKAGYLCEENYYIECQKAFEGTIIDLLILSTNLESASLDFLCTIACEADIYNWLELICIVGYPLGKFSDGVLQCMTNSYGNYDKEDNIDELDSKPSSSSNSSALYLSKSFYVVHCLNPTLWLVALDEADIAKKWDAVYYGLNSIGVEELQPSDTPPAVGEFLLVSRKPRFYSTLTEKVYDYRSPAFRAVVLKKHENIITVLAVDIGSFMEFEWKPGSTLLMPGNLKLLKSPMLIATFCGYVPKPNADLMNLTLQNLLFISRISNEFFVNAKLLKSLEFICSLPYKRWPITSLLAYSIILRIVHCGTSTYCLVSNCPAFISVLINSLTQLLESEHDVRHLLTCHKQMLWLLTECCSLLLRYSTNAANEFLKVRNGIKLCMRLLQIPDINVMGSNILFSLFSSDRPLPVWLTFLDWHREKRINNVTGANFLAKMLQNRTKLDLAFCSNTSYSFLHMVKNCDDKAYKLLQNAKTSSFPSLVKGQLIIRSSKPSCWQVFWPDSPADLSKPIVQQYIAAALNSRQILELYMGVTLAGIVQGVCLDKVGRDELRLGIDAVMSRGFRPPVDSSLWSVKFYAVEHSGDNRLWVVRFDVNATFATQVYCVLDGVLWMKQNNGQHLPQSVSLQELRLNLAAKYAEEYQRRIREQRIVINALKRVLNK